MGTACDTMEATLETAINKVRTNWNDVDTSEAQKLADFIIEQDTICDTARTAQTEALQNYVSDKLAEFDVF